MLIKYPIQTEPLSWGGDDAVRALFGGEDFADVVGAEAAATNGVQRTGQAAHHFIQKPRTFGGEG